MAKAKSKKRKCKHKFERIGDYMGTYYICKKCNKYEE